MDEITKELLQEAETMAQHIIKSYPGAREQKTLLAMTLELLIKRQKERQEKNLEEGAEIEAELQYLNS